jgi:hypothetical protein
MEKEIHIFFLYKMQFLYLFAMELKPVKEARQGLSFQELPFQQFFHHLIFQVAT